MNPRPGGTAGLQSVFASHNPQRLFPEKIEVALALARTAREKASTERARAGANWPHTFAQGAIQAFAFQPRFDLAGLRVEEAEPFERFERYLLPGFDIFVVSSIEEVLELALTPGDPHDATKAASHWHLRLSN